MFIKTVIVPFRVFQWFCVVPLRLKDSFLLEDNNLWTSYSLFTIAVNIAVLTHGLMATDLYTAKNEKPFSFAVKVVLITTIRVLAIVILTEALAKRKKQIKFIDNISKIDSILKQHLNIDPYRKTNTRSNSLMPSLWLITYFSHVIVDLACVRSRRGLFLRVFYVIPLFVSSLRYLQMILQVNAIQSRLAFINETLRSIFDDPNAHVTDLIAGNQDLMKTMRSFSKETTKIKKYLTFKKLLHAREIYHLLYENVGLLSDLLKWSLPINVSNDFFCILINVYWCLLWLLRPNWSLLATTIPAFVGTVVHMLHLVLVCNECHYTVEEVWILIMSTFCPTYTGI